MGIWSEELCKMFLIVGLFLPFSSLFLFVSIHLNLLSIPTGGKGQGRAGRNETGLDQHGRRQKRWTVRGGGGAGATDGYVSIMFKCFLLSSPSHSSSFGLPFSTEYNNRRGGAGHDQRRQDDVSFAPSSGGPGGKGTCSVIFCSLFSSSLFLLFLFSNYLFFRED